MKLGYILLQNTQTDTFGDDKTDNLEKSKHFIAPAQFGFPLCLKLGGLLARGKGGSRH